MKSFRILLLALLSLTVFVSCDDTKEKDLEVVDSAQLLVSFKTPDLDNLWGPDWKDEWQYSWDTNDTTYGPLGYTVPEIIKGTIYNIDTKAGKRLNSFLKIFDLKGSKVLLPAGTGYDMLFYNMGTENIIFDASIDFEKYTASTIITPYGVDFLGVPYKHLDEPDELLGAMVTDVDFGNAPSDYEKETDADGNVCYIRNIDVELNPYSIIYLIQVVFLNNDDDKEFQAIGASEISITGLSQGVELFSRKTFDKTIMITTEDVKPLQNHSNVHLEDGTVVEKADILAARMLTWGFPDINPMELSKDGTKAAVRHQNYIGIRVMGRGGHVYYITNDITDQIRNKPAGGVLTVCVDVNDIGFILDY